MLLNCSTLTAASGANTALASASVRGAVMLIASFPPASAHGCPARHTFTCTAESRTAAGMRGLSKRLYSRKPMLGPNSASGFWRDHTSGSKT